MSEARDARNNGVVSKDNTDEHQQKRVKWLTKTNPRDFAVFVVLTVLISVVYSIHKT